MGSGRATTHTILAVEYPKYQVGVSGLFLKNTIITKNWRLLKGFIPPIP